MGPTQLWLSQLADPLFWPSPDYPTAKHKSNLGDMNLSIMAATESGKGTSRSENEPPKGPRMDVLTVQLGGSI